MRLPIILALAVMFPSFTVAQQPKTVLLPESAARGLKNLCSRTGPDFSGTWKPTMAQITAMERDFDQGIDIKTPVRARVDHPEKYNRQYIGLIVRGRKMIYINALHVEPSATWSTRIDDICDGGAYAWGVLYDVDLRQFVEFSVNGSA